MNTHRFILIGHLADTVRVGLTLDRVDPSRGDLRDMRIDVIDKDRVYGMARVLYSLLNKDGAMLGQFSHRLGLAPPRRDSAEPSRSS